MKKFFVLALVVSLVMGAGLALASEETIEGTVEKTDTGVVLMTDDAQYNIAGADLTPMLGKKVKATGTVEEGADGKTINVVSFEEVME